LETKTMIRGGDYEEGVFGNVTPCGCRKNLRFGGTYRSIIRVTIIGELVTTIAVTS
jgi:hypothetical protein